MSSKSIILTVCGVGAEMVAVRGGIDADFGFDGRSNNYLCFSDGTVLLARCDVPDWTWRFVVVEMGRAECAGEFEGVGGFVCAVSVHDTMLDAVSVRGDIRWVAHSTSCASPGRRPRLVSRRWQ